MMRSSHLFLVLLVSFVPVTSAAQSERTNAPTKRPDEADADREQARHLYDDAIQFGKRGEYRRAKASLAAAWSLIKTWEIAVNLGSAEMRLGQYREAAEHLAWGIRDASTKESADFAPLIKAKALLREAAAHVGKVKLVSDVPGASIFVDDQVVGRSPLPDALYLDPGAHVISARPVDPEGASLKLDVHLEAGDELERFLHFRSAAAAVEKTADKVEPTPVVSAPPPAESTIGPRTVVPVTLAGLTAVSAGLGLAFVIKASAADSSANDWAKRTGGNCDSPSAACSALADARDRRNDANQIANVAWVGAGMFGVATLVTTFFWPHGNTTSTKTSWRVVPQTGQDVRGIVMTGVFE